MTTVTIKSLIREIWSYGNPIIQKTWAQNSILTIKHTKRDRYWLNQNRFREYNHLRSWKFIIIFNITDISATKRLFFTWWNSILTWKKITFSMSSLWLFISAKVSKTLNGKFSKICLKISKNKEKMVIGNPTSG